jgi:hypothetical protein
MLRPILIVKPFFARPNHELNENSTGADPIEPSTILARSETFRYPTKGARAGARETWPPAELKTRQLSDIELATKACASSAGSYDGDR